MRQPLRAPRCRHTGRRRWWRNALPSGPSNAVWYGRWTVPGDRCCTVPGSLGSTARNSGTACAKHLRRLRYALEFAQACLPRQALARQLAALQAAQEALGLYNDLCVARRLFADAVPQQPAARWAVSWLTRRAKQQAQEGARCLHRLVRQPVAWD